jgi:cytochrome c oxidase subunit 2
MHAEAGPWQINFEDPATPIAARIIEIHHHVFFFLLITLFIVVWVLFKILFFFRWKFKKELVYPYTRLEGWYYLPWMRVSDTSYEKLKDLAKLRLTHHTILEVVWTCIPSFVLIAIAIPSFGLLYAMDDVIDPEITIKAIGHQWYWSYEYSDYHMYKTINFDSYMLPETNLRMGQLRLLEVDNCIVLPMGVYVRVNISASDVLHCWAVPSLGIKIDAVPHRINSGTIFLQRLGIFHGQCSEICGVNHGFMPIVVKSVTTDNYLAWINNCL